MYTVPVVSSTQHEDSFEDMIKALKGALAGEIACSGYKPGSPCDGGTDPYIEDAYNTCIKFVAAFKKSKASLCVAACLTKKR